MAEEKPKFENKRKCPSCQKKIELLQLSVYGMPTEQFFLPWLRKINDEIGYSIRTHGQTQLNELQFLCFTHICQDCGHISWWDLGTEELHQIAMRQVPDIAIKWNARPETIDALISKATSQEIKSVLEIFKNEI